MKSNLIPIFLLLFVFSCKKNKDIPASDISPDLSFDSLKALPGVLPVANYADLTFTNENTGYAISQGLIVKTINGGQSWTQLTVPMNIQLKRIQFTDSLTGYIIGGDSSGGYLFKTINGGQSWEVISLNTPDIPNGMFFTQKNTGYITGKDLFIKTTDGGINWINLKSNSFRVFYDVKFKNTNEGIATSSNGVYFITNNGGVSWDSIQSPFVNNLTDIYFTATQSFVATSSDTLVDVKNNYKVTKKSPNAFKLLFIDPNKCIGIGNHYEQGFWPYGDIFITNNGWATFKQKTFLTADAIAFTAIAKMTEKKIMILGLGFTGTKVLLLTR